MLDYEMRGNGPAILFLHPVQYDRSLWSKVTLLLEASYSCVLVNERGVGFSPRTETEADRVDDLSELTARLGLDDVAIVASSTATATALAMALDGGIQSRCVIIFRPGLAEYLDPRSGWYMGDVMDRACRDAAVKLGALKVRSAALHGVGSRMSVQDLQWDASARSVTVPWYEVADDMMTDFKIRAHKLQRYRRVRVADRVGGLTTPVTLVPVLTESAAQRDAEVDLAYRLARNLRHPTIVEMESEWSDLVPLADPERVAQVIRDAIVRA